MLAFEMTEEVEWWPEEAGARERGTVAEGNVVMDKKVTNSKGIVIVMRFDIDCNDLHMR